MSRNITFRELRFVGAAVRRLMAIGKTRCFAKKMARRCLVTYGPLDADFPDHVMRVVVPDAETII